MSVQVSRPAPEFKTQALVGREFQTVSLADYRGKWLLLVFYPMDFTFVCPTELVGLNEHLGGLPRGAGFSRKGGGRLR